MPGRSILLFGFLITTCAFSLVYASRQKSALSDLESSHAQLRKNLADAQAKIQILSSQVAARAEAAAEPTQALSAGKPSPMPAPVRRRQPAAQPKARPRAIEDPRWRRVESQLAEHQSQLTQQGERIDATQETLQKTGDQLDGKINSTRDELNRSIATTHDDVVLLQKRGEHNIYEFDLPKSKQFQRVGPLSLSLRKTDAKHRVYDLTVMVNDVNLDKKHVNLFEPVWINLADRPQPVQLVVNQIDKNQVRGYISEPRYKTAELAGSPAPATPQAPALKTR